MFSLLHKLTWALIAVVASIAALPPTDSEVEPTASAFVDLADLSIDRETGDRVFAGEPFTGEARRYAQDGALLQAEQFIGGRRNGYLKMWFPSGLQAFDALYRAGRRNGLATSWWSNGNKRSQTNYVNDQPDGVAWSWYRTGEVFKRYSYAAGQPVGLQQAWRRNGKLFSNFEYRNGRTYGLRNSNLCVGLENEQFSRDY